MDQEFDKYARNYEDLLKDPIRDAFTGNASFFAERKWMLIRSYFASGQHELSHMSWLDVGCGKGELLRFGRRAFGSVVGCDVSTEMLEYCPDIPSRPMTDSGMLPFPDESFDFLTAVCVYHHVLPDRRAALTAEAHRVLRSGGFFSIIEHNPFNPATRIIVKRTPVDQNAILLSAGEARRSLRDAGFDHLQTRYFLYLPERLFRLLRWTETALQGVPLGGQYAVFARKQ
jgi:ubiquinone/menaquinone biosynthesis C-methylase UbiE